VKPSRKPTAAAIATSLDGENVESHQRPRGNPPRESGFTNVGIRGRSTKPSLTSARFDEVAGPPAVLERVLN